MERILVADWVDLAISSAFVAMGLIPVQSGRLSAMNHGGRSYVAKIFRDGYLQVCCIWDDPMIVRRICGACDFSCRYYELNAAGVHARKEMKQRSS